MPGKIMKYMSKFKLESILGPLLKLTEAGFELFVPLVVAQIIDKGIAFNDKGYIWSRGLILLVLGLLGLFFSVTAQYFAARAAVGISGCIRKALFEKITRLSSTQLDELGNAGLIQRLTGDMDKVQNGLNLALRLMLRSPFVVVGSMIMAFIVDARSAVIFAVIIPLLAISVFGIMSITIPLYSKHQHASEAVTRTVKENLEGTRVIRAFGMEENEDARFGTFIEHFTETGFTATKVSALTNPLTSTLINIALIVLIYRGAVSVETGVITQGQLVALVNYMSQILVELIKLSNLIVSVTKALACFKRVQLVIDLSEETSGALNAEFGDVIFVNVSFAYPGGENAVSNISFTAEKGTTIGIVGPTGAGKTTLLSLLQGLYRPQSGRILISGTDINEIDKEELKKRFAVVTQNPQLFSGSLAENITLGNPGASETEIMNAVLLAQASDIIAKKSDGLNAEAGQAGRNLSGGQRQRLALARAFIKDSDFIVLDDSASALDMKTDAALRKAIREELSGKSVFIVSQRASSVKDADKILVMDDGYIIASGKHDELFVTCQLYKEIYECQFPEGETSEKV